MIQDIAPHRFNNHYDAAYPFSDDAVVLYFEGRTLLMKCVSDTFKLPVLKDFKPHAELPQQTFLFTLDDRPCFLLWDKPSNTSDCFEFRDIGFFRTHSRQEEAWVSIAAFHLKNWYEQNRYCGFCGALMVHKPDERALVCTSCKRVVYPQIAPAVIVAITGGDRILLARGSNMPGAWYSLIAGYVDVGETLEDCVRREVKEEVGLDVTHIKYYKSQPWPLSGSMMIGFTAEADPTQPITLDHKEIADAAWFSRGHLPAHPPEISIAGEMIDLFNSRLL